MSAINPSGASRPALPVKWVAGIYALDQVAFGERHRERVAIHQEEAKYLAAAAEPISSIAAILYRHGHAAKKRASGRAGKQLLHRAGLKERL